MWTKKVGYAVAGAIGSLVGVAPGVIANTGDMVNETTGMVSSIWPFLLMIVVISLIFGAIGKVMKSIKI